MFYEIFIGIGFLLVILYLINNHRGRSLNYRKLLTNLYIATKIRKVAEKEGLDLKEEFKEYKKLFSKENKDIDNVIEEKLSTEINQEVKKSK